MRCGRTKNGNPIIKYDGVRGHTGLKLTSNRWKTHATLPNRCATRSSPKGGQVSLRWRRLTSQQTKKSPARGFEVAQASCLQTVRNQAGSLRNEIAREHGPTNEIRRATPPGDSVSLSGYCARCRGSGRLRKDCHWCLRPRERYTGAQSRRAKAWRRRPVSRSDG